MEFLHPELLWLLLLNAVPIIIHLFHFRRHKTLYFSSLKFIQFVEQENKSAQKLRNLLVLIARILALSLLVIAFAQPQFGDKVGASKAGKTILAIYIDNSYSMSAKGTEGELLSEAREMAKRIIKDASLETGILLNTNKLDGIEQRIVTKVEALDYLDKISFTPIVRTTEEVLQWQQRYLEKVDREEQKIAQTKFILLSDFQKNSFSLKNLKPDEKGSYFPVQFLAQNNDNLAVDSIWFSNPFHKMGEPNEVFVQVANFGNADALNTEMHLEIGSIKRDLFLDVPAGKRAIANFQFTEFGQGFRTGKISLNDKQIFWDDDFYFAYEVAKNSGVLVIDGADAHPGVEEVFAVEPFYKLKSVKDLSFTKDQLTNVNLVVFNGLNEITSGMTEELMDFSDAGGTIFIFPGASIDKNSYNNLLADLQLPSISGTSSAGTKIDKINYRDPFFKGVFEKETENLNVPTISKAYSTSFRQTTALPLLNMRNGSPLLVRSTKNGFLFLSSLEKEFSSFASNALFPTVLLRCGEFSVRTFPLYATIGKENKIRVFEEIENDQPLKLKNKKIEFIPVVQNKGSYSSISISGLEAIEKLKAGSYDIINQDIIGNLALNYDRTESNNTVLSKNEIEKYFVDAGIKNVTFNEVTSGQSKSYIEVEDAFKYWKIFAALALFFVLCELAILKFWK